MTWTPDGATPDARIAALEAAVADLQRRLAMLESAAATGPATQPYGAVTDQATAADPWSVPPWPEVVDLLRRGKKIEAIKVYRQYSGLGLKEAKDVVDEVDRRLR